MASCENQIDPWISYLVMVGHENWTIAQFLFHHNGERWRSNNYLIFVLSWWWEVKIGHPFNSCSIAMARCENQVVENFLQVLTFFFSRIFSIGRWWRFLEFLRWMNYFVSLECEMSILLGWGLNFWRLDSINFL